MKAFDHVIVGTGQSTGTLLSRLIPTGDSIAVIEGAKVGGSCVNYGCTPTKTLVASARAAHMARQGEKYGHSCQPVQIDYQRVRERMNSVRMESSEGLVRWMGREENVTLLSDWATFENDHVLKVGGDLLRGQRIYLNVGTRPAVPAIDGLESVPWLDSARLLDVRSLPSHLVIIGGGYIGIEFGQIFRRFGSEVTLLQDTPQLMPREDADVAQSVRELLEREGVQVLTEVDVGGVEHAEDGVRVRASHDGRNVELDGSHLLVATGNRPNTDGLGLERTSIETDSRGFIRVDDFCRTSAEGVFALGDVNGHGAFTHT